MLRSGGLLLLRGVEGIGQKAMTASLERVYTSNGGPCQCVGGERSMVLGLCEVWRDDGRCHGRNDTRVLMTLLLSVGSNDCQTL